MDPHGIASGLSCPSDDSGFTFGGSGGPSSAEEPRAQQGNGGNGVHRLLVIKATRPEKGLSVLHVPRRKLPPWNAGDPSSRSTASSGSAAPSAVVAPRELQALPNPPLPLPPRAPKPAMLARAQCRAVPRPGPWDQRALRPRVLGTGRGKRIQRAASRSSSSRSGSSKLQQTADSTQLLRPLELLLHFLLLSPMLLAAGEGSQ